MRWVIYLLLVLNLGLFVWKIQSRAAGEGVPEVTRLGDQAVGRLPLLAELGSARLRPRERPVVIAPEPATITAQQTDDPPSPDEAPAPECVSIGPLDGKGSTKALSAWLKQREMEVHIRSDERREVALYWVYIPPLANRKAAAAQLARLRAEGISDSIVVPRGDKANAISLGVFSRKESLRRRVAELNAKGYEPSTALRYRSIQAHWVDVATADGDFPEAEFNKAFPRLQLASASCSKLQIATPRAPSYNNDRAPPGGGPEAPLESPHAVEPGR